MSTEGAFLVIALVLLLLVIVLTGWMYLKVRKLRVNPNAYGQLKGQYNQLGQMM